MARAGSGKDYEQLIKLLLIGDSGVGKSCLLLRFAENSFTPSFITTIGIDFKTKRVNLDGKPVKIQVWDTAGQERFRTITSAYYRGAHGIVLCYDVSARDSFSNIRNWMKNCDQHASGSVVRAIVGNKKDVSERAVSYEEGKRLADEYGVAFTETSAKTGEGVDDMFMALASAVNDRGLGPNSSLNASGGSRVQLDYKGRAGRNNDTSGCCS
jgi:Ras-related protein Rab-8A